jgi:hypothetical protein
MKTESMYLVCVTPPYFDNARFAKAFGLKIGEIWQEGENTVYPASLGEQDLSLYVHDQELETEFKDQGCSDSDVLVALMEASNDKKVKELKTKREEVLAAKDEKMD